MCLTWACHVMSHCLQSMTNWNPHQYKSEKTPKKCAFFVLFLLFFVWISKLEMHFCLFLHESSNLFSAFFLHKYAFSKCIKSTLHPHFWRFDFRKSLKKRWLLKKRWSLKKRWKNTTFSKIVKKGGKQKLWTKNRKTVL